MTRCVLSRADDAGTRRPSGKPGAAETGRILCRLWQEQVALVDPCAACVFPGEPSRAAWAECGPCGTVAPGPAEQPALIFSFQEEELGWTQDVFALEGSF